MELTHAQRFDISFGGNNTVYAPLTLGCPAMTMVTDYSVFKKTDEEKWKVHNAKRELGKTKHHNFKTITHVSL